MTTAAASVALVRPDPGLHPLFDLSAPRHRIRPPTQEDLSTQVRLGLPAALLPGVTADLGPVGVWWGLTAGLSASCVILWARFLARTTAGSDVAAGLARR